jgi:hypothetical protein
MKLVIKKCREETLENKREKEKGKFLQIEYTSYLRHFR